jgi:GNAT superfamily N-acetyltransferase
VGLSHYTGNPVWDGVATLSIGFVLAGVACILSYETHSLLIGESVTGEDEDNVRKIVAASPDVRSLVEVLTMHVGPEDVILAMKVAFDLRSRCRIGTDQRLGFDPPGSALMDHQPDSGAVVDPPAASEPWRDREPTPAPGRAQAAADLDAIVEIERVSFKSPWGRDVFQEEAGREWAHIWVARAEGGGPALGFINFWLVRDEIHILNVGVLPAERRKGYAAELIRRTLGFAWKHHVRYLTLEVRRSNLGAIKLYKSSTSSRSASAPTTTRTIVRTRS